MLKAFKFKQLKPLLACISIFAGVLYFHNTASVCFAQIENKIAAQEKEDLFALIDKLEKSLPFRSTSVAKLTGRIFIVDPKESDKWEICSRTQPDFQKLVSRVSVYEPAESAEDKGGFVDLEINTNAHCIVLKDILHHFGMESSIHNYPPTITGHKIQYLEYCYKRPWGQLIFAVTPNIPNYLLDINFSSYRTAPPYL